MAETCFGGGKPARARVLLPAILVPAAYLVLAALALEPPALRAQTPAARAPIVALPHDAPSGTEDFYFLDLGTGTVTRVDQLRRDPVGLRAQRQRQNLFREIGRPADQPAAAGEILLAPIHSAPRNARSALFVETSTGFLAFYEQFGRNGAFGQILTVIGRPFATLAAADGNFALLMRHDSNGRTVGAFLYHAGSGKSSYLSRVNRLDTDVPTAAATGFPQLTGRVAAAEIHVFDRTASYLVADAGDGSLRFLDLEGNSVKARDVQVGLFPTFAAEAVSPADRRFTAVPIRDARETTTHVLFADAATGELAVLEGVENQSRRPVLRKLGADLYTVLGSTAGAGWRTIAAVPGVAGNGATSGVWLIDSLTRRLAYVQNAENPGSATVRRINVGG